MGVCERCTENGNCAWQNHDETICREKPAFPITNADRIRAMSDEELAEWITGIDHDNPCPPDNSCSCSTSNCRDGWLAWLRQEVDDG